jgi:hypothetical protein
VSKVAPLAIAEIDLPESLFPNTSTAPIVTVTDVPAGAESTPVRVRELILSDVP